MLEGRWGSGQIREAKAALEAEAKAEADEKARLPKKYRGGRKPKTEPGTPKDKARRNFTDPESRIMRAKDGFIQGYNAQAAVDGAHASFPKQPQSRTDKPLVRQAPRPRKSG